MDQVLINALIGQVKSRGKHLSGNPTYQDLAAWSEDNFRVANYTSSKIFRPSGFTRHRSSRDELSMELEYLELGYLKLFEKLHAVLLVFVFYNLNRAK